MPRLISDIVKYKVDMTGERSFFVSGEVNVEMLKHVYTYLNIFGVGKPITMILNSDGGDLGTGFAIHDMILNHPSEVNIIVSGCASSAASVILQAGFTRFITKSSYVMIHMGGLEISPGMSAANKKAWMRVANLHTDRMINLYADLIKIPTSEVRKVIKVDQIYVGHEAVKAGLCDIVV